MTISVDKKLAWFDRGAAAVERTFPGVLKECVGDGAPRYVCPLCDEPFPREAVLSGDLTAEHVPPESFGGRELLLTCRVCNNTAGSNVDSHARKRENIAEAKSGDPEQRLAVRVALLGLKLQARLEPSASDAQLKIDTAHNNPTTLSSLQKVGVIPAGTRVEIEFWGDRYSELKANMSWLRSGFLALFALAGYKFSFDPAVRVVKEQLRSPDQRLIYCHMINVPQTESWNNWSFVELSEPRCNAVMFSRYAVLFPLCGDVEFYQQLEKEARAREAGNPQKVTTASSFTLVGWEPYFGYEIPERRSDHEDGRESTSPEES